MAQTMTETKLLTNSNLVRVGFYFFKPSCWFGWLVVALQWLCGGRWNSHCHMMHSIDSWLFETTIHGTVCSDRVDTAFRLADDVFYIMVDEATAFDALEVSARIHEENMDFRLWECIVYCWQLLWTPNVEMAKEEDCGGVNSHLGQNRATPPFSCTTVVWACFNYPVFWNSFTPAKIYGMLKEETE